MKVRARARVRVRERVRVRVGVSHLLYLGARVVEVHEQPAQQVLEVGAVEVGAVGVVARVAHRVQKVDERRAHLEAAGVGLGRVREG